MREATEYPLTVLAWEGPQARAYLVALRRAGLIPERILLMVLDPKGRRGRFWTRFSERRQDKAHNHHPYAMRSSHPALLESIDAGLQSLVAEPAAQWSAMFDGFSFDDFSPVVNRVVVGGFRDPYLFEVLSALSPTTVLFTGGGIVPANLLSNDRHRVLHVHPGFLPHVRGADGLLWSILVRGRPGFSCFVMEAGLDTGDVLACEETEALAFPLRPDTRPDDDTLYRAVFSFVDPLLRANLLVSQVLTPDVDPRELVASPQDQTSGVTYHFLHPDLRARGLDQLFPVRLDG